jgi:hypothetical protein
MDSDTSKPQPKKAASRPRATVKGHHAQDEEGSRHQAPATKVAAKVSSAPHRGLRIPVLEDLDAALPTDFCSESCLTKAAAEAYTKAAAPLL